jgi:O-acetylserine/cysteine efflux transporter
MPVEIGDLRNAAPKHSHIGHKPNTFENIIHWKFLNFSLMRPNITAQSCPCDKLCFHNWRNQLPPSFFESLELPLRHILLAVLVACILGVSFVAIRIGTNELPPLLVTGYRFLFAAFPLVFFIRPPKIAAIWVISYGLFQGALLFGFMFTAMSWGMPGGLTSLVVQMQVFFTIALSGLVFREMPLRHHYIGAGIAIIGIVITGYAKLQNATPLVPFLLVLCGAASWGVSNILSKAARPPDMLSYVVWSSLAAPVPLFLASMAFEGTSFGWAGFIPTWQTIIAIAFMAYFASIFAFTAWTWLLRQYPAATVTPFALLIPIFGFSSMALVFGERISVLTMLGALVVFLGLAINVFGAKLFPSRASITTSQP